MDNFLPPNMPVIAPANADRVGAFAELTHQWGVTSLAFSPDGVQLMTGHEVMRLWRMDTGVREAMFHSGEGIIRDLMYGPDGSMIAAAGMDGTVRLWTVDSGVQLGVLRGQHPTLKSVAVSPSGWYVAAGSGQFDGDAADENAAYLWNARRDWHCTRLDDPQSEVCVAFNHDGSLLAGGELAGGVWLWQVEPLETLGFFAAPDQRGGVLRLAFSPDGSRLAGGGYHAESNYGGAICVWDVESGAVRDLLVDASEVVTSVAYSPDGSLLASAGRGAGSPASAVRLWDAASHTLLAELHGHTRPIEALAFNPDGTLLASGGGDRALLWAVRD